jgi:hypothetical protein
VHDAEPDSQTQNPEDGGDWDDEDAVYQSEASIEAQSRLSGPELNVQQTDRSDTNLELSPQTEAICRSREEHELQLRPQDRQRDGQSDGGLFNQLSPHILTTPSLGFILPVTTGLTSHQDPSGSRSELRNSSLSTTSKSISVTDTPYPSYIVPSPYYDTSDALHGLPERGTHRAYTNLQESCLVKHFIKNLAHVVSQYPSPVLRVLQASVDHHGNLN